MVARRVSHVTMCVNARNVSPLRSSGIGIIMWCGCPACGAVSNQATNFKHRGGRAVLYNDAVPVWLFRVYGRIRSNRGCG
jgi:hypothetical protein